jgi:hypothetical protein
MFEVVSGLIISVLTLLLILLSVVRAERILKKRVDRLCEKERKTNISITKLFDQWCVRIFASAACILLIYAICEFAAQLRGCASSP